MSFRATEFIEGEYYHIYNRGVNKMPIFIDKSDYQRFLKLLYTCNDSKRIKFSDIETRPGKAWTHEAENIVVGVHAYVLMPNHFHILISQRLPSGITEFMQRLTTSYSMYFNKKYNRNGAAFQGKFKSEHAKDDSYFRYLFSYIHLNPLKIFESKWKELGISNKNNAFNFLKKYSYSSYLDYLGENRPENKILDKDPFFMYCQNIETFKREIFDWLSYGEDLSVQALPGQK